MELYVREKYLKKMRGFYHDTEVIKVITGVRRCGKSCLMKTVMDELLRGGISEEHLISLDLDSLQYRKVKTADRLEELILSQSHAEGTKYLFIDEVQNVAGFEEVVNAFREDGNYSIFITGSNSYLLSGELVPGRYYQTVASKDLSSIRRLYPSATAANGWSAYAQQLAKERGYIVTDEELLFLAWIQYRRTAAALAEIRLQTKQYSYADAVNFLTAENGFTAEEAEQLIKQAVVHPGETISYIYGLQAIEKARAKYARKMGKKFNLAQFHSLLLQAGNVPPAELEKEIDRLQERAQKQNKNLLIH